MQSAPGHAAETHEHGPQMGCIKAHITQAQGGLEGMIMQGINARKQAKSVAEHACSNWGVSA